MTRFTGDSAQPHMRIRSFCAAVAMVLMGAAAAQTPTADQLDAFKNLPKDQQDAILQGLGAGKSGNAVTKTDSQLKMPQTVLPGNGESSVQFDRFGNPIKEKTSDGRLLRQKDEDPELRANDTILIDLRPLDDEQTGSKNGAIGANGANPGLNSNGTNSGGVGNGNGNAGGGDNRGYASGDSTTHDRFEDNPRSEEHRKRAEEFRRNVLDKNPYRLNRYGALEIPGLPAIPMAGLTAEEATTRLAADPDMRDFRVKVTLLRLQQFGDEALKPFGYDLFQGVPSTFAPVSDIQVPPDYVVGPGDTINVQLYGNDSSNYALTVGRDGRINFPKLGPVQLSGMTYDAARAAIERRVGQQLIGTRVSVTMGELRSIRVFVLGEAEKPGSYTVSGLSTMTNALFVSGGVKKIGSLRNIQLKRHGELITTLDLYDLLLRGNTGGDRQLMPGDVIFIPPIGTTVSVDGAVRRPAIYELKTEKDVAQAIAIAGGLLPDADQRRIQLERIFPSRLREMRDIDMSTPAGRDAQVINGDKLRVPAIRPTLENSVLLSGFVFRPGAFEYRPGLRLSDILTSFDELRPNADRHYIMIRRELPPEQKVAAVSADLEQALKAPGSAADPELRPRDQIFVFDLSASRERIVGPVVKDLELQGAPDEPARVVSIDGKVKAPGRYPLEQDMRVSDLIRAGGSMEDAAFGSEAELTRYEVFDGKSRLTELVKVDLAAIRRGVPGADIRLKPYDILIIKTTPQWDEPGNIELAGEVRFPGKYPIHRGETLHSVLIRAGGFTDIAFGEGAVFIREELKRKEKEQLETLTNRFQSDLTSLSLQALANSAATTNSSTNATQGIVVGQQLLEQLRNTKPVGRLVIDIDRVLKGPPGVPGDVVLRDGDKLFVPKKTQEITILGEVQSPTSHIYIPGLTRDEYIARSGGITQKADRKRIYVVRANGNVVSGERTGWFRRSQSIDMRPGRHHRGSIGCGTYQGPPPVDGGHDHHLQHCDRSSGTEEHLIAVSEGRRARAFRSVARQLGFDMVKSRASELRPRS